MAERVQACSKKPGKKFFSLHGRKIEFEFYVIKLKFQDILENR